MKDFKLEIAENISSQVQEMTLEEIISLIEVPPNKEMGDYAFPCFKLAKVYRKSPNIIAQEISSKLQNTESIESINVLGGYINFFVNKKQLAQTVIKEILDKKDQYGSSNIGQGKKVIVEFSSPNIAKPFHIGHIRSTVIGNSLEKIYKFLGYETISINHLGDYGTQFGKLIVAFKKWGSEEEVKKEPIPTLLKLYIKFHEEAEKDPSLEDEGREWFKKLEEKDEEATRLWQWFRDVSLEEFNRVYDMLNIKFDSYAGESFYSDKMDRVIEIMKEKNILKESKGALIVDLEDYKMPPALIKKSDGSTLYITRDITAALYRKEHYDFYKNIYVVASQQNLHFQQWFKVIELMGFDWAKDCIHVPFGLVSLEEGTIATRKGRVVFLEDVLNKAIQTTKDIIKEKNPNLENIDEVAKQVGIGAVVFQELSNNRIKDYTFSWERTLNFDGETGPYVQYTHVRTCSLLRKANEQVTEDIDFDLLTDDDAINVITILSGFNKAVVDAMRKNEPHIVARYVVDLSQAFNKFYHDNAIIVEDENIRKARLALVKATKQTIKNALSLLGIAAPERM
ncbi:arginyl-tRNA synthetase [Alkalithermobacter thermoalcaliphilus JW-YL-7 = DSM 7308]|uniref:Arginine--tRNA ligase n=1 Tax=Alkalithermobacter thermoalcaliphilus JW-YL-7 = DSM 7308 TaxID=1121328 RepID=A0A150FP80_CLOPD|nr:Arginyl-tRNA synthetase [[Clostridium] paradoxum JW-YL-7 = DSM 7308]SHK55091.1 arginyl-tRNA synthetase [[Clostridium] paradoxum JW-YL-7 = DSM 7308]